MSWPMNKIQKLKINHINAAKRHESWVQVQESNNLILYNISIHVYAECRQQNPHCIASQNYSNILSLCRLPVDFTSL